MFSRMNVSILVGLCTCLWLSGCASTNNTEDFASRLIAEKSAIAAGAQRDMAQFLAEDTATVATRQAAFDTDTIDIDYIGNPVELVQSIAARYGFAFNETGRIRTQHPINIRMKSVTPDSVLRNIGNQVDSCADVILDRSDKSITYSYKSATNLSLRHGRGNRYCRG